MVKNLKKIISTDEISENDVSLFDNEKLNDKKFNEIIYKLKK